MDLLCFCSVLCSLCLCARLLICALWSPAGKGLTSWLLFVVFNKVLFCSVGAYNVSPDHFLRYSVEPMSES